MRGGAEGASERKNREQVSDECYRAGLVNRATSGRGVVLPMGLESVAGSGRAIRIKKDVGQP